MDKYYYVLSLVRIFSRLDAGILFTNIWIIPLKFSDGQLHFCFKVPKHLKDWLDRQISFIPIFIKVSK